MHADAHTCVQTRLQLDANNQMRSQIRGALFRSIFGGNECPYLILRVRRDNLIRDTLLQISGCSSLLWAITTNGSIAG